MTSNMDSNPISLARTTSDTNIFGMASPPLPLSPRLSRKLSGLGNAKNSSELGPSLGEHGGSQSIIDYSVDRQLDTIHANVSGVASYDNDAKNEEKKIATKDISRVLNPSIMFKHPTHLITPSEILMSASSSETTNIIEGKDEEEANIQDVVVNSDVGNTEVEVKEVGETRAAHGDEFGSYGETQNHVPENREKLFCSQASDLGIKMATENHFVEEVQEVDGAGLTAQFSRPSVSGESEAQDSTKDVNGKVSGSAVTAIFAQSGTPSAKGKKQTGSNSQVPDHSSSVPNSAGSFREPGRNSTLTSAQANSSQIATMQNTLNQLMTMQKELQKQMSSVVTLPVTKEGRRLEASLGRGIEKAVKANTDALWARFQEENGKNEKLSRDRSQQITNLITNLINKDLTPVVEKAVKRELAAVGPAIVRTISPSIEKTISSTITESFQRGVSDKAVNMLERSVNTRLEATVGRQIQAQFQTSGKIALQDALKSGVEASVFPAFEKSCKAIFEQVDATFQKGMAEHSTAALQHFESAHSPLALALRDSITSTSSLAQTLSGELADVQRKLISLAAAGGNPSVVGYPNIKYSLFMLQVESSLDPAKELSRLISERKYEEAFIVALQRSDVSIVSWLCSQVDLHGILATVPLPLSQGVLLSLLQQLAVDINNDTHHKLAWLTDVAAAINPTDPVITTHARPIFDQVYQRLHHQRNSPTITGAELSSIRLLMHVINSMMMTCKPQ
ncbi:hypothetical protein Pint_03673 [Pistacia integerrima]|uniref:Uncharacterized protein n=1 Tax=Pistacia integerrima TaxID=434235 RepID=A0ACC0Z1Z6_9ROSI|nr:hypothetical protein Pint_03673 [Pistacia integerrima]